MRTPFRKRERETSRTNRSLVAAIGLLAVAGLLLAVGFGVASAGARAQATTPAGSPSDPPGPITQPPAPVLVGGPGEANAVTGFAVAASWPTVVVGVPGAALGNVSSAGEVLVKNMQTGTTTSIWNPNPAAGLDYGFSVALSSSYLVVGAPGGVTTSAYVYNATTLTLLATLLDPLQINGSTFGFSVAVSGTNVVVGAPTDMVSIYTGAGRAYVFTAPSWSVGVLSSPQIGPMYFFGYSVAISGPTIVVGSPGNYEGYIGGAGVAYEFNAATDMLVRNFTSPTPVTETQANFGYTGLGRSVSVVGNMVAVGAPDETAPATPYTSSGVVFLYNLANGSRTELTSPRPQLGGLFGTSVALGAGGAWLAVGAENESAGDSPHSGTAYMFDVQLGPAQTVVEASPAAVVNGSFGESVAVSGGNLVVGAPGEGANDSGAAYVYKNPDLVLAAGSNPVSGEEFGFSVGTTGTYTIGGAPQYDNGTGAAWVLDTRTNHEVRLTSPSPQSGSLFGYSVAVSGTLAVVGEPVYSNLTYGGIGIAYVFNATTGALVQTISVPSGAATDSMVFGFSVAISGTTVVIGAPFADSLQGLAFVCGAVNGTCWNEFQPLSAEPGALVGYSVAVNGSTVVVGAPGANSTTDGVVAGAGLAWVMEIGGVSYRTLNSANPQPNGGFGISVGVDASSVIVGAWEETAAGVSESGAAYIFNSTTDAVTATLLSPNAQVGGEFGESVGISANTAIVGAPNENSSSPIDGFQEHGGDFYLFSAQTGVAAETFNTPYGFPSSQLGQAVGISGGTVVVGQPGGTPYEAFEAGDIFEL